MNDFFQNSVTAGVVISLAGYFMGTAVKKKWNFSFMNPLLISIVLVIGVLFLCGIDYDTYNGSARYLSYLLAPATVSLAIPLYQQLELLKKNVIAIFAGVLCGVLTSLVTVLGFSVFFHLSHEEYVTLLPKSITTAIGMGISEELGGYTVITTAVIIITGVLGNMMAETVCRVFRIKNAISRGIAIGTASHAIGTTKAMEMGEIEGAMSSLAIAVSGLCTVIWAAVFANIL